MSDIHESVFIAEGVRLVGDIEIGEDSSVWYNTVLRANDAKIRIGKRSNVQDSCVFHAENGVDIVLGDDVTIGHMAIVHCCEIGDATIIGMGATVMTGAKIGKHCLIGAGALVTENSVIPDGSLVIGMPGKVKRELTPEEQEGTTHNAQVYVAHAKEELEKRK